MKSKKLVSWLLVVTIIFTLVFVPTTSYAKQTMSRKIIIFKAGVEDGTKDKVLRKIRAQKIKDLKFSNGVVVNTSSKNVVKKLSKFSAVLAVEDDIVVKALGKAPAQPVQTLPWGINRIDAEKVWATTTADTVKVGIVDTGIDITHPDLKANIKGGFNAISTRKSYTDDNGHGSHVAGIVGALNNTVGAVGVGPNIDLYSIKVLGANGSGYLSDIIDGLDWAIANKLNVLNMSLGTTVDSDLMHQAVVRAYDAGITVVAAAGNDYGAAVNFPAAYPEVIAVSATDVNNNIASFSSAGPQVDIAAPGVSIYSTYKGASYATLSGTSMASPHVTGAAAILLSVPAKCDINGDEKCTPAEVQARLQETAIDCGAIGKDNQYGYGIVNVYSAIN